MARPIIEVDGTEVQMAEEPVDEDLPAHLRRGRFDRRNKRGQSTRQRVESDLVRIGKGIKDLLWNDDDPTDDFSRVAKKLGHGDDDE